VETGIVKEIVVFGGPNGAGKTTMAARLLPSPLGVVEFVNADEIARGLSPFDAEQSAAAAGSAMIERIDAHVQAARSFAFETTCAGHRHVRLLKKCRDAGYRITLLFLWLPSADVARERVALRVRNGGHHVPDHVVVRRYAAGLRNMRHLYLPLVDIGLIYDNSDEGGQLIAERRQGDSFIIHDEILWRKIEESTR
jgi:predicted ABC-type ATPase